MSVDSKAVDAKKVVSSLGWVALANYSNRILRFVTTLILAKLLTPEDFGMVALASMVIDLLYLCKDLGISQALIYRQDDSELSVNTGMILVTGFNTLLFVAAALAAPWIARFYENPRLTPILIVLSSNLVWIGLKSAPEAKLRKNMAFRRLVVPNIVPVLLASAVSITMAFQGYGVWSLVVRSQMVNILGVILIFRYAGHRPSLKFDRAVARSLFRYGKFIIGTSVFLVLFYNLDRMFISHWGGLVVLGYYTLAMRIASLPVSELSHMVCRVMFPVLSKLANQPEKLRETFCRTIQYSSLVSIPMSFGIAIFVPPVVAIVYGDKWIEMIVPLQILAFYAMFRSFSSIVHETFKAIGVPFLMQRYVIVRLILLATVGTPIFYFKGLNSFCMMMVVMNCFVTGMELWTVSRRIGSSFLRVVAPVGKPVLVAGVVISLVYAGVDRAGWLDEPGAIAAAIVFVAVSYLSIMLLSNKTLFSEMRRIMTRGS